jgi:hypothetical protein
MPAKRGRPPKSKHVDAAAADAVEPDNMDEDMQLALTLDESMASNIATQNMNYMEDPEMDKNTLALIMQLQEQERIDQEARDYELAKSIEQRDQQYANQQQAQAQPQPPLQRPPQQRPQPHQRSEHNLLTRYEQAMAERNAAAANDSSDSDENPYRINIPDDDEIRKNIMKKQNEQMLIEQMRMERMEQDAEYETALLQHKDNGNIPVPRYHGTKSSNIVNEAEELLKRINEKYNLTSKPAKPAAAVESLEPVSGDGPEDEEPLVPKSREDLRKARMQWLNKMSK